MINARNRVLCWGQALGQPVFLLMTIDLGLPRLAEDILGDELMAMDAELKQQMFAAISDRDVTRLTQLPVKWLLFWPR